MNIPTFLTYSELERWCYNNELGELFSLIERLHLEKKYEELESWEDELKDKEEELYQKEDDIKFLVEQIQEKINGLIEDLEDIKNKFYE